MAVQRPPAFRGRTSELDALDRLLENVRGGQSGVLVIHGEAGVGKTALLRHVERTYHEPGRGWIVRSGLKPMP